MTTMPGPSPNAAASTERVSSITRTARPSARRGAGFFPRALFPRPAGSRRTRRRWPRLRARLAANAAKQFLQRGIGQQKRVARAGRALRSTLPSGVSSAQVVFVPPPSMPRMAGAESFFDILSVSLLRRAEANENMVAVAVRARAKGNVAKDCRRRDCDGYHTKKSGPEKLPEPLF